MSHTDYLHQLKSFTKISDTVKAIGDVFNHLHDVIVITEAGVAFRHDIARV